MILKKVAYKIEWLFKIYIFPIAILSGINKNFEKAIINPIMRCFSKYSNNYIRYISIPKQIKNKRVTNDTYNEFAIILQGPVLYDNNFTEETIKLYQNNFPNVKIIVSTWKHVKINFKDFCKNNNIYLIENEIPQKVGAGNINCQIISSLEGVRYAEYLKCKYVVKTRTDQRVYVNDMLDYFSNLWKIFPPKRYIEEHKRLIFISYGKSFLYRPFCLCDFLVAGSINDMKNLYNIPLDYDRADNYHILLEKEEDSFNDIFKKKIEREHISPYEYFSNFNKLYYKYFCSEEYIVYNYYNIYYNKINKDENLLNIYHKFLKDEIIVIDSEQLLLFWPKYKKYYGEKETELEYYATLNFKKWVDIYNNII